MTINQILNIVDQMKPNAFPPEVKIMWINEVEGYVQTYIHLVSSADVITYDYSVDAETELLVPPPHNGVYWTFLTAMIDYGNGEYNKYQNTITLYNNYMAEYQRWYATVYRPADGEMEVQGYYLSAYAIAVKHGFSGSEEDWIASLKGERGEPGERGLDGEGLNIVGFYDTYDELLKKVPNPTPGEAYGIGTEAPYVIYIWDKVSLNWKNNGTIKGDPGPAGKDGSAGKDAVIFTPSVSEDGNLSWSNDGNLTNPPTVNVRGPAGKDGSAGKDAVIFTPKVDTDGNLSWSNDGGLSNPGTVNIRGPVGKSGNDGDNGATYTPSVSATGDLTWSNDGGLPNPTPVNLRGKDGKDGKGLTILGYYDTEEILRANVPNPEYGDNYGVGYSEPYDIYTFDSASDDWKNNGPLQGAAGEDGVTFTPSVSADGDLSWSNDGGLENPPTVNIRGPRGPAGADGVANITSQTVTLLASAWTDNGDGRYVQTAAVAGVTESTPIVMVDVALYSNAADVNALIVEAVYQTDGSIMQQPVVQDIGVLTFYTVTVPSVDIPLYVGVIG